MKIVMEEGEDENVVSEGYGEMMEGLIEWLL